MIASTQFKRCILGYTRISNKKALFHIQLHKFYDLHPKVKGVEAFSKNVLLHIAAGIPDAGENSLKAVYTLLKDLGLGTLNTKPILTPK